MYVGDAKGENEEKGETDGGVEDEDGLKDDEMVGAASSNRDKL